MSLKIIVSIELWVLQVRRAENSLCEGLCRIRRFLDMNSPSLFGDVESFLTPTEPSSVLSLALHSCDLSPLQDKTQVPSSSCDADGLQASTNFLSQQQADLIVLQRVHWNLLAKFQHGSMSEQIELDVKRLHAHSWKRQMSFRFSWAKHKSSNNHISFL